MLVGFGCLVERQSSAATAVANRCVRHWSRNAFVCFLFVCFLFVCFSFARFVGFFCLEQLLAATRCGSLALLGGGFLLGAATGGHGLSRSLGVALRWVWATEGDFLALAPTTFVLTEKRNLLLLRAVHAELYQGREADETALAHYEA